MTRHQDNTRSAGVDGAKAHLDLVLHAHPAPPLRVPHSPPGLGRPPRPLPRPPGRPHRPGGLRRLRARPRGRGPPGGLRRGGPPAAEIRAWARLTRTRAKTDRIDAALIAAAAAQLESLKAVQAGGERLEELAERLAAYEQVADEVARLKTFRDRLTPPDLKAGHEACIRALE